MEGIVRPRRGGLGGGPRAGLERESLRDKGPEGAQREGGNLKDSEGGGRERLGSSAHTVLPVRNQQTTSKLMRHK